MSRKPKVVWKREESPSVRISNTNAERNPSVNNQIINTTDDTGSDAMSDEFEGKLFINQRNESDDAQLQE